MNKFTLIPAVFLAFAFCACGGGGNNLGDDGNTDTLIPDTDVPSDPGVPLDPGIPSDLGRDDGNDTTLPDVGPGDPGVEVESDIVVTDLLPVDPGAPEVIEVTCEDDDDCIQAFADLSECRKTNCDMDSKVCVFEDLADDTPCGIYDLCVLDGKCQGGACVGGSLECDDGDSCTSDSCDPVSGCVNAQKDDGADCDDGLPCTINDKCTPGQVEGEMVCEGQTNCPNADTCLVGTCDSDSKECEFEFRGENAPCDDGDGCTVNDRCIWDEKGCYGDPKPCPTGNPCTASACVAGECGAPVKVDDGTPCASDVCKVDMTCVSGVCQGGTAAVCDDGKACTDDFCAGGCQAVFDATNSCSDGLKCTYDDHCVNSDTCQGIAYCNQPNPTCDGEGNCYCLMGKPPIVCDARSNNCEIRNSIGCQCTTNTNDLPCPAGKRCGLAGCF